MYNMSDIIIKSLDTEVKTQFEEIQKLESSQEFSALIRAAKGDTSINLEELKYAGIKTIDIICLDRVTTTTTTAGIKE